MAIETIPPMTIHWRANARNGMYPSAYFWHRLIDVENHLTAVGTAREVFSKSWELGGASIGSAGTTSVARFRFRTSRSATSLAFVVVMTDAYLSGGAGGEISSAQLLIDVKISGGATSSISFYYGGTGTSGSINDQPDAWNAQTGSVGVTASTVYEVNVQTVGYARPLAVMAYEESSQTVSESTSYYNTQNPIAGLPIYDADRQRILEGLSNMYRQGGIVWNWSLQDGTARTRSGTEVSLFDGSTAGTPTAGASNGFYFDPRYHRTASRTTVPFEWGVYASIPGGAGTCRLIDTSGTTYGTITINSATPQWWTATFSIAESAQLYLVPQLAGDGVNTLSVYAASIIEYESGP